LLNKSYPIECKRSESHSPVNAEHKKEVKRLLKSQTFVLLGFTATEVHTRTNWTTPVMMLADHDTIESYVAGKKHLFNKGNEILPPLYSIQDESGKVYLKLYETTACHSYHSMRDGSRVASIPTILQFFFAYLYSNANEGNIANTMCAAQRLIDIAKSSPKRRFALLTPKDCLGTQETLVDMRKHKATLYEKLSKNKGSADFLRYFFTYNPNAPKTERAQIRNRLRKTRRVRAEKND
jgi:hypothetical protein